MKKSVFFFYFIFIFLLNYSANFVCFFKIFRKNLNKTGKQEERDTTFSYLIFIFLRNYCANFILSFENIGKTDTFSQKKKKMASKKLNFYIFAQLFCKFNFFFDFFGKKCLFKISNKKIFVYLIFHFFFLFLDNFSAIFLYFRKFLNQI